MLRCLPIAIAIPDIATLCDRIAVLSRGRLTGIVENGAGAEQRVGELMVGRASESAAA